VVEKVGKKVRARLLPAVGLALDLAPLHFQFVGILLEVVASAVEPTFGRCP